MEYYQYVIETVDHADVVERIMVCCAYSAQDEFGIGGFDISDYIVPELYKSVRIISRW